MCCEIIGIVSPKTGTQPGVGEIQTPLEPQRPHRLTEHLFKFIASAMILALLAISGCKERNLRGNVIPSKDGRTYLVVDDENGGRCGPILVDGRPWPYPVHMQGPIAPGKHVIGCGLDIEFSIPSATVFHFNYWGP